MEKSIGLQIKKLRNLLNLSQGELAQLLEVTQNSLSLYESDKRIPSLEVAIRISEKTGVSLDWICGLSKELKFEINSPALLLDLLSETILRNNLPLDKTIAYTKLAFDSMKEQWSEIINLYKKDIISYEICLEMLKKVNEEAFGDETYYEIYYTIPFLEELE
ncbi:MAG: helix-turn-helix transcriptional regulator [Eubacteriaceae bacterium]